MDGDTRLPLFVYGTLRSDCCTDASIQLSAQTRSLGTATIAGVLYSLAAYPGLVMESDGSRVRGELLVNDNIETAADTLRRLDEYEGCDDARPNRALYRRVKSSAVLDADGMTVGCWVYVYNRAVGTAQKIASGCWRTHLDEQR